MTDSASTCQAWLCEGVWEDVYLWKYFCKTLIYILNKICCKCIFTSEITLLELWNLWFASVIASKANSYQCRMRFYFILLFHDNIIIFIYLDKRSVLFTQNQQITIFKISINLIECVLCPWHTSHSVRLPPDSCVPTTNMSGMCSISSGRRKASRFPGGSCNGTWYSLPVPYLYHNLLTDMIS